MNARNMSEILLKLKEYLGLQNEELIPSTLIVQLEMAINAKNFDDETVNNFKESKQRDGRYIIHPTDIDLIKNTKALINLLISLSQINIKMLDKLKAYAAADSDSYQWLKLADIVISAISDREKLKLIKSDVNHFIYYMKKLGNLLPDLPELKDEARNKIYELQNKITDTEFSKLVEVVKIYIDEEYAEVLNNPVPTLDMTKLMNIVEPIGLRTNINAIVNYTKSHLAENIKNQNYSIKNDRFEPAQNTDEEIYNLCREIKLNIERLKSNAYKMIDPATNPLFQVPGIKWKDISEELRECYKAINQSIVSLSQQIPNLIELSKKNEALKKIVFNAESQQKSQIKLINEWVGSASSSEINGLSLGTDAALKAVTVVADQVITMEERAKYFDASAGLYNIPDNGLDEKMKNQMLIYNISVRARSALHRINTTQQKYFPNNIIGIFGILDQFGSIVNEYKKLNTHELKDGSLDLIKKNIEDVVAVAVPIFERIVIAAYETENRLGIKDGIIIKQLEPISKQANQLIKAMKLSIIIPQPPYDAQERIALANIRAERVGRIKSLNAATRLLRQSSDDPKVVLFNSISLMDKLSNLNTYHAAEYVEHLQKTINQLVGIDVLELEIRMHEKGIINSMIENGMADERTLSSITTDELYNLVPSEKVIHHVDALKKLYQYRIQIKSMIDEIRQARCDSDTDVRILSFSKANPGMIGKWIFSQAESYNLGGGLVKVDTKKDDLSPNLKNNLENDLILCIKDERIKISEINKKLHENDDADIGQINIDEENDDSEISNDLLDIDTKPLPTSLDSSEILRFVIEKEKGQIILQSENAREKLIQSAMKILSPEQKQQLEENTKIDGMYQINKNDKTLVMAVKVISNTMTEFEDLIYLVNQLQDIINDGSLRYLEAPELLRQIKSTIKSLLIRVSSTNDALMILRNHCEGSIIETLGSSLTGILSGAAQLPTQFHLISNNLQLHFADKVDSGLVADIKKLASEGERLKNEAERLRVVPNDDQDKLAGVNVSYGREIDGIVMVIKEQISSLKRNDDGSYDLSQLKDDSPEKILATSMNVLFKLTDALNNLGQFSEGRRLAGSFGAVINLISAYRLLQSQNIIEKAGSLNEKIKTSYGKMNDHLMKLIKNYLNEFSPTVREIKAQAALSERLLGLSDDILLGNANTLVKKYVELCESYNVNVNNELNTSAFSGVQENMSRNELERLNKLASDDSVSNKALISHQKRLLENTINELSNISKEEAEKKHQDDLLRDKISKELEESKEKSMNPKIKSLIDVCKLHKHYLFTNIQMELLNSGMNYDLDDESKISIRASVLSKHPNINTMVQQYNVMHDMLNSLESHEPADRKIVKFTSGIAQNRALLSRGTDSAGIIFLKVVATILSLGFAALFGIWRPKGEEAVNKLEETIASDDLKSRMP